MNKYPVVYAVFEHKHWEIGFNGQNYYYPFYYGISKCFLLETLVRFGDDGKIYREYHVIDACGNQKRNLSLSFAYKASAIFLSLKDARNYQKMKNEQIDLSQLLLWVNFDLIKYQIESIKENDEIKLKSTSRLRVGYKVRKSINKREVINE